MPAVPRPGGMGAGSPYAGGGMMYAPAPPGMHPSAAGGPRMYPVPGVLLGCFAATSVSRTQAPLLPSTRAL
jgi:hypothetical protein